MDYKYDNNIEYFCSFDLSAGDVHAIILTKRSIVALRINIGVLDNY